MDYGGIVRSTYNLYFLLKNLGRYCFPLCVDRGKNIILLSFNFLKIEALLVLSKIFHVSLSINVHAFIRFVLVAGSQSLNIGKTDKRSKNYWLAVFLVMIKHMGKPADNAKLVNRVNRSLLLLCHVI